MDTVRVVVDGDVTSGSSTTTAKHACKSGVVKTRCRNVVRFKPHVQQLYTRAYKAKDEDA